MHQQLQAGAPRARPPGTGADEWGLIGDAAHDPTSDHSPHNFPSWGNQIVTAADFPNRPDLGLDAHRVLDDIRRSRDGRVKYGISNGQMFSSYAVAGYGPWTWRPYNPKNGDRHFTHGHLSVVGDARADGTQPWQTIGSQLATGGDFYTMLSACKYGDKGFAVFVLQATLLAYGFSPGDVDGGYGDKTAAALAAAIRDGDGKNFGYWEFAAFMKRVVSAGGGKGEKGDPGPQGIPGPQGKPGDAAVLPPGAVLTISQG
ncbi:hypothetical protein ABT369_38925 [Dactylosporangium sp. NPDC000244]|uniref:peptidoglycan-binding domain-containing protein n=1 Tax=Dactylosporangium sp. NPDC000244 TaxID=3154365 RepID=UPI003332218A